MFIWMNPIGEYLSWSASGHLGSYKYTFNTNINYATVASSLPSSANTSINVNGLIRLEAREERKVFLIPNTSN